MKAALFVFLSILLFTQAQAEASLEPTSSSKISTTNSYGQS